MHRESKTKLMKRVENFIFNDIVLYSKGWLYHKGDLTDDLKYLFSQVYAYTSENESEIALKMLRVLDLLYQELELPKDCAHKWLNTHAEFEEEVRNRMWVQDISRDRSIILTVRSILQMLSQDEIKLNPPHYGKHEHFRMGSLFGTCPISMTYTEMNRKAKKAFSYK